MQQCGLSFAGEFCEQRGSLEQLALDRH